METNISERLQQLTYKHAILRLALCAISNEGLQEIEAEALGHFALDLESETRSIQEAFDNMRGGDSMNPIDLKAAQDTTHATA